jgi:hypothetical protein
VEHVLESAELIREQTDETGAGRWDLESKDDEEVSEPVEEDEDVAGDRRPRRRRLGMRDALRVQASASLGQVTRICEVSHPSREASDGISGAGVGPRGLGERDAGECDSANR